MKKGDLNAIKMKPEIHTNQVQDLAGEVVSPPVQELPMHGPTLVQLLEELVSVSSPAFSNNSRFRAYSFKRFIFQRHNFCKCVAT